MRTQDILKELRNSFGVSLKEAATHLKVSYQELEKWEKGYKVPTKYGLEKLSAYYQVSIDELADISFVYKIRLLFQHIQENWFRLLFVGLFLAVVISWVISFTLNLGFGLYNVNRPKDYVDHHLRVMNETEEYTLRYSFDAEFVNNNSLNSDFVIYVSIPKSAITNNQSVYIDSLDSVIIENNSDIIITHFECVFHPNADKPESFIVQMTLGDTSGQRFAASNFFSFYLDTDQDYYEVEGINKIEGDIVVYGGDA